MQVAVVNPLNSADWNQTILHFGEGTIFHSVNWAELLADSYGYKPAYFTVSEHGSLKGCLPLIEVNSVLTGRRGVSVSFSDYCHSLVQSQAEFEVLFNHVLELGRVKGWRYVEFRGEKFLGSELPTKTYAHDVVELSADERLMHSRLKDTTARNIRKAAKEGVAVEICQSLQGVREFYRLHCLTRKRHGLPPQPARFFDNLHRHVISQGYGFTALATHGNSTPAGLVCLYFGNNAIYKYGASDAELQHLRANNLVMWESMRHCAKEGFSTFSLGRTELDNEGLLSFKNGWGGNRTLLKYHRYDFERKCFVPDDDLHMDKYKKLLSSLPVYLLKALGTLAYRHIG